MRYHLIFTDWFNRNLKSLRKRNARLRQDVQAFLNGFDAEAHPIINEPILTLPLALWHVPSP